MGSLSWTQLSNFHFHTVNSEILLVYLESVPQIQPLLPPTPAAILGEPGRVQSTPPGCPCPTSGPPHTPRATLSGFHGPIALPSPECIQTFSVAGNCNPVVPMLTPLRHTHSAPHPGPAPRFLPSVFPQVPPASLPHFLQVAPSDSAPSPTSSSFVFPAFHSSGYFIYFQCISCYWERPALYRSPRTSV